MTGDYYGLPTREIGNRRLRIEFLAESGPRIVRVYLAGSKDNQMAEVPDLTQPTPYGDYHFHGGHRLWHAPESLPRSYLPDDGGLQVEELPEGVRLVQPTEAGSGISKMMEILVGGDLPSAKIVHTLRNDGPWAIDLAPWALTQVPLGGVAVLPQTSGNLDASGLLPNRSIVLWPYTHVKDPRLEMYDDYVLVRTAAPGAPDSACKVGSLDRRGWVGYLRNGVFFVKRFDPKSELTHPDFNCNAELYCGNRFLEVESIGAMTRLEPGQSATHVEDWSFHEKAPNPETVEGIRGLVSDLGLS